MYSTTDESAMKEAISEAYTGINTGDGGPFGCMIVKDTDSIGFRDDIFFNYIPAKIKAASSKPQS